MFQNPTVVAAVIGGIALLFGSLLTLVGGFFGTYFLDKLTNKAEKRKFLREKLEEIYTLTYDPADWSVQRIYSVYEIKQKESLFFSRYYSIQVSKKIDISKIEKMYYLLMLYSHETKSIAEKLKKF